MVKTTGASAGTNAPVVDQRLNEPPVNPAVRSVRELLYLKLIVGYNSLLKE